MSLKWDEVSKVTETTKTFSKTGIIGIGKDKLATLTQWWSNRWKHNSLPPIHISNDELLLTWRMKNAPIE